jgi:hypothetical protein
MKKKPRKPSELSWTSIRKFIRTDHPSLDELDGFVESGQQIVTDDPRLAAIPLHLRLCDSCAAYVQEAASGFSTIADLLTHESTEGASEGDWNRLTDTIAAIESRQEAHQLASRPLSKHFAPKEWLARVADWVINTGTQLAPATRTVSDPLRSAGPIWTVGKILEVEIRIVPLEGQFWLCCVGASTSRFQLTLTVDEKPVTSQVYRYGSGLLLVPLGSLEVNRVDAEIFDGSEFHKIAFVLKR